MIAGLASIGLPLGRGLLLLAEMSSKGTLAKGSYSQEAVQMARDNSDFVIGFIAMGRVEDADPPALKSQEVEDFLILTPGVALDVSGDSLGQQYRTPHEVVHDRGCDVIIVGRGIYGDGTNIEEMQKQAIRYKEAGWKAYLSRLEKKSS